MSSAACFISGRVAPGAALDALLSKEPISLAAIDLVCCEQQPQEPSHASTSKYNVVLVASCEQHNREALSNIARCMAPGARLYVYEAASISHTESATSSSRVSVLKTDLLLSGFTDAEELSYIGANATQPAAWLTARLPQWGLGAAAKLSLKRPAATTSNTPVSSSASAPAPAAAPAGNPASVWKLAASDGLGAGQEDEDELLDDEQLLTEEDKKAAPKPVSDDCEVGASGRKACKNCTCGRAEAEAAGEGVKLTADMLENPQSACGSCYLGDAFRCATCPYRGLPSFEPGQKISLGASMLAADV